MGRKVDKLLYKLRAALEAAKPLTTKQRNDLKDSDFAFPKQRKMPIDSCNRVRAAMSRFNQVEGVSAAERRTAYRKIIRAANRCGIDSSGFRDKFGKRFG